MADTPRSFAEYIALKQRQGGSVPAVAPVPRKRVNLDALGGGGAAAKKAAEAKAPQSPLNWFMDILSRPLHGVTNIANQTLNEIEKAPKYQEGGVKPGEVMGALSNIATSGVRGVFSNEKSDKAFTSDLIERTADVAGKRFSPKYKDVENNVNPIVKGVVGFAGDVALDPLTYIPGAAFVGIGKKLSKIGEGQRVAQREAAMAKEVDKGTYDLATNAEKAVDKSKAEATKFEKPKADDLPEVKTERIEQDVNPVLPPAESLLSEAPKSPLEEILASSQATMSDARMSPRAGELQEGLAKLTDSRVFEVEVAKAGAAVRTKPLPFGSGAKEVDDLGKPIKQETWLGELDEELSKLTKLSDAPSVKLQGKTYTLPQLVAEHKQGNAVATKALQMWHERMYLPSFAKAKQVGAAVNALGKKVDVTAPVVKTEQQMVDMVQALKRQVADSESEVVRLLGPKMTEALGQMGNPDKLDATVQKLSAILGGELDIHHLSKSEFRNPFKTMLRELGVDPITVPVGQRKPRPMKNDTKPPAGVSPEAAAMVEKMGGTPSSVGIANEALKTMVERDILEPLMPGKGYNFKTKKGTFRTQELYGDGYGRNHREANTYLQFTLSKSVIGQVAKELADEGLGKMGMKTAALKQQRSMEALRLAEDVLDSNGVIPTIGVGADRLPISLSQILDDLSTNGDFREMQMYFWNQGTAVPQTALMEGVYQALKTGDPKLVREAVSATETRYMTSDGRIKPMPNNLVNPVGSEKQVSMNLVDGLTDLIMRKRDNLDSTVSRNQQAWNTRVASETYDMTDKTLSWLQKSYESEAGFGPALEAIHNAGRKVADEASNIGATQKATDATGEIVNHAIPAADKANADGIAKIVGATGRAAAERGSTLTSVQRSGVHEAQKRFEDVTAASERFVPGGDTRDFGKKISQSVATGIVSKLIPVFSRRSGTEMVHEAWLSTDNVFKGVVSRNTGRIRQVASKLDTPKFAQLLTNVQRGVRHPDPAMAAYQDEVADIWGQMFGAGERNGLIDNAFFRENNMNVSKLNELFAHKGINQAFDIDAAGKASKLNGTTLLDELAKQPASWKIDDPADFLNKAYTVLAQTQTHQTLAQQFVKMAKDLGGTSAVPKKGYSLVSNTSGGSILSDYLPHDMYINDIMLRQMHVVDNLMQDSIKWDGPVKDFIDNVYRPVQDAWKYGMTLINPTHHIRNAVSDASLTFVANGVRGKNSYVNAGHAMAARNGYTNWDAIKFLQGLEELPNTGKMVAKGKLGELTADGLQQAASNRGNLPTFKQLENLEEEGRGKLAEGWQNFTGTRGARAIGGVSEARDHYFRLAHFSQVVEQNINNTKRFKRLEDMLDYAAAETRRWHPDGTDLTAVERDIFRLIIPFYSWQRKAIPLVLEAAMTKPGRVLAFPKASMNLAVSMGVNPDSLSDPFPDDQMFPTYMTDSITGPQFKFDGKYYAINPGIATNDVLNDFLGADAGRSVLGSVSPIIRAPFELAAGAQVGTGAQINDTSDYVDSNLPIVGPASRITGTSVTGSLSSMIKGEGLDPQYQVAQGNKKGNEALPLINWLTGIGLQPMSQKNQINYAEIEARDREKGQG